MKRFLSFLFFAAMILWPAADPLWCDTVLKYIRLMAIQH